MPSPLMVSFAAGSRGDWIIDRIDLIAGEGLAAAQRLSVHEGSSASLIDSSVWMLRGITSNTRYAQRFEVDQLATRQEQLGRPFSTRAALIPIRKADRWWALAQDERRAIVEEQSRHIRLGLEYLPAIARRLHHSRELGEPFDFLTWFEYAPEHSDAFDELVIKLRSTEEWRYVDREVDIRLSRQTENHQ